ncbi:MAG: ABC transporter substrate-binding protein [Gemmatimonadales bacterium]
MPRRRAAFTAALLLALGACGPGDKDASKGATGAMDATAWRTITVVDPSLLNWLSVTWSTMEELVRVDKDGHTVPTLATGWKWLDPRTIEFKLREGVQFQDGEPFTAKNIKRSFDEVQRWKNPHPPGAFLNFDHKTTLAVVDDHTVRFTFPQPDAAAIMKFRGMHVGSTKFWDSNAFVDKTSGTAESHW